MKRLVTAAFALVAVFAVAGSALAATGTKASVVYDNTSPNGAPTNQVSYGSAAYSFNSIGDKITLGPGARSLSNVTVTLSSWACHDGTWYDHNCVTPSGATFSQPITLTVYKADGTTPIASKTQTFDIPYRPSASSKCTGPNAGKWMTPHDGCKNGIADDVSFSFSGQKLDDTVVYAISYPTDSQPSDSLNVAVTDQDHGPSVGHTDAGLWIDGALSPGFDGADATHYYTPMVQFKASNAS